MTTKKRVTKKSAVNSGLTGTRNDIGYNIDELPFTMEISKRGKITFTQKVNGAIVDATAGLAMQYMNLYYQKQILRTLNKGDKNEKLNMDT